MKCLEVRALAALALCLCPQVRRRAAAAVTLPLMLALRAVLAALAAAYLCQPAAWMATVAREAT